MHDVSGRRLIALALSLILFAAVFVWDIPSSYAEEPPAESPTTAPTETAEPEPTETPVDMPLPIEEPAASETPEPSDIAEIPNDIPELTDDIQLPETAEVPAEQMEPSATSGDYDYADIGDGTVMITGYHGAGGDITIPSDLDGKTVTSIGDSAFTGIGLTSLILPNALKEIGQNAFKNCTLMESINIPNSVQTIEGFAFAGCNKLKSIFLPSGIRSIKDGTFWNCTSLYQINMPENAKSIGYSAFENCDSLVSIEIPDYITSIGESAFYDCNNLECIKLPMSLTSIGQYAFSHCKIIEMIIPDGVKTIGMGAFSSNQSLQTFRLPDKLVNIPSGLLAGCWNLKKIDLPTSVQTIGNYAFADCEIITAIELPESIISIGECAFLNCLKLNYALFYGNAPDMGVDVFKQCDKYFTVFYKEGRVGFTDPWHGYSTSTKVPGTVYTLSFNSMRGNAIDSIIGVYSTKVDTSPHPYRNLYTFDGWYPTPLYNTSPATFPYTIKDNATLYAKWKPYVAGPYLTNISLSAGALTKSFYYFVNKYTIILGENEPSVTLIPDTLEGSSMTINGKAVSSTTVSLANGKSKTVTIKVKYGKKSSTYKFTVTRAKSGDNNLSSLTNMAGVLSQPFDPNVTNYALNLDEGTSSVTINAAKSNTMAKVSPASKKLTLKNGQTKVLKFTVKAQSGAKKIYTVTVTRAPSTNTNLKSLKTSVPLSPGFSAAATDYTLTLPANKGAVTISAKAFDKLSKVTINGAKKASQKITLANGQSTMVSVVVTSQAGTTKEYRILVQRP